MAKLSAQQLQKKYKQKTVVDGISLTVESGEIVGLLGPNGAGKTTSFYMMVGLIQQDAGHIWLDNQDLSRIPMHMRARKGIGYLPQEASIFRKMSVAQNIQAALEKRKHLSRQQKNNELEQLLNEFSIEHLRKVQGQRLSGGERRRVEIARALATAPTFILLDEPFAGVDPLSVTEIKNIILHLKQKKLGILITDHNVREMLDVCDRAYIVHQGQVIAAGSSGEILKNDKVKRVYLGEHFRL